ncbi:universal stress protein [Mucilaginibacter segetis]|uniref:Universal stress protein n=1 Tax=Mucilaginibacter segetis TaxID=2793071 RepID=A0A934PV13_9SPHI|nr:universal stress protein [Mucilaginibacter segetis]MBK0379528.1 universal stress protein [Mucilaginibacter segetis]
MKTYLVPIDFSEAALNAADFAAHLSNQSDVINIILVNAYYISPYEQMLPNPDMMMIREQEIEENVATRFKQLQNLKHKLSKQVREGVKIHIKVNRSHLLRAVVDITENEHVDLVILGSIGNSTVRENNTGLGSHVIKISKASPVPVIVVPPVYSYKPIKKAVIAFDFKKVKDNVPVDCLKKLLGDKKMRLLIVNIDPENKYGAADEELLAEEAVLHNMLQQYEPEYFYINESNVISGVLDFAAEKNAQIVIALPHRYSFLQSILHNSISQQLAANSQVPVLLLK